MAAKIFDKKMDGFHSHTHFFEGWKDLEIPEDLIIQLWLTLLISFA